VRNRRSVLLVYVLTGLNISVARSVVFIEGRMDHNAILKIEEYLSKINEGSKCILISFQELEEFDTAIEFKIDKCTHKRLFVIVGLPGSGKTTLTEEMKKFLHNPVIFDDASLDIDFLKKLKDLNTNEITDIVITDPYLCLEDNQILARAKLGNILKDFHQQWIYFENNPEQAKINSDERNKNSDVQKKVSSLIDYLSPQYYIPDCANIQEIYKGK